MGYERGEPLTYPFKKGAWECGKIEAHRMLWIITELNLMLCTFLYRYLLLERLDLNRHEQFGAINPDVILNLK